MFAYLQILAWEGKNLDYLGMVLESWTAQQLRNFERIVNEIWKWKKDLPKSNGQQTTFCLDKPSVCGLSCGNDDTSLGKHKTRRRDCGIWLNCTWRQSIICLQVILVFAGISTMALVTTC
eukprot:Pompholyxophrys_punicea_v1_NODE_19_length_5902_cov_21.503677.p6 type:complete len:120 gc:universal NODE_19_length_5902_cov_21.503677:3790-4149(+)